jgi:hypothetical protein
MKLIFLSGLPGVGKLTVAKELSALTGFKLFHNHLTVDLLISIFEFGSLPFIELRESIWLSVFDHAARANLPGLIFTFNAENTVCQSFITDAQEMVSSHGGQVLFIELFCDEEVLEQRMDAPSRHEHKKLTSWKQFLDLKAAGVFSSPKLPAPLLSVDTGEAGPRRAALLIAKKCGL